MFKIERNRFPRKPRQGAKPKPGVFNSEVVDVRQSPRYAEGDAIIIHYKLTEPSGTHYSYEETFRIKGPASEREQEFDDYLSSLGFRSYDDIVGMKEYLTLEQVEKGSGTYLNITERKFVAYPPDVEVTDDVADE